MHHARIGAPADDGRIRHIGVVRPKLVQHFGHDLVFHAARTRELHRAPVRAHRDLRRPAQIRLLGAALVQAHVVQHVIQRDELPGARRARPRTGLQAVQPRRDVGIEVVVRAHGVEDPRPLLDQPRQDLVDVLDGKRIVRAVALDRALGTGPRTVPRLAQRVALADEQQVLGVDPSRHQNRDGFRLGKAGQIVEMAVLPVGVLDVAIAVTHRRRRKNRDRILADHAHELPAAARELLAIHGCAQCSRC